MNARHTLRLLAWLLPAALVGAPAGRAASVTLVEDGRPACAIVLPARPTRAAAFAALELQHHIRLVTGAAPPIRRGDQPPGGARVFVGPHPALRALGVDLKALPYEGYVIAARPHALVLAGRDAANFGEVVYDPNDLTRAKGWPGFWEERGTLHAVYDFLERCVGVRWFDQTEFGTYAPRRRTLIARLDRDVRRAPAFEFRDALGALGDNPARYDEYVSLWPRSAPELREWIDAAYPKLRAQYRNESAYRTARGAMARLFALRRRNGGKICRCNHSLYGYYDRFWSKNPRRPELFVERRPEYFAKGYQGKPPQMCYTDPGLVKQLAQDARDYYDGKKTGAELGIFWRPALPNLFPVEPMDNRSYCKCPRCQKWIRSGRKGSRFYSCGEHSNYFFQFVNRVAQELNRTHPRARIVALAYSSHAAMPDFELSPNVAIQFCFASNRSPFSKGYAHELQLLKQWATEGKGRPLYLWLYYTFPKERAANGRYHCFPGFFAHTVGEQFRLFHHYGIRGVFHCGYGQLVEAYVTFRLMDDPSLDIDALLDEYFRLRYGPAAGPMKKLYLDIEKTYCDPALRPKERLSGPALNWGRLGTAERMARYAKWMQEARRLARSADEKARVRLFELGVWRYMTSGREQFVRRRRAPIPSVTAPRVPSAGGDPNRVDWTKAAPLPGPWRQRGSDRPAARALAGRVAHDGRYLYIQVVDPCDTARLNASAMVFPYDDWELFLAAQRAVPYRQYAWGPTGMLKVLSHGEVNFRRNVPMENPGARVVSDTTRPALWTSAIALPLDKMLPAPVKPGDTVYLNILRISSPALAKTPRLGIDSWVSFCTVHEVDRLAAVTLAK